MTTEDIVRTLAQALYFDPRKLFNADGSLKAMSELDEDAAAALVSIEVVETGGDSKASMVTRKIRWQDKNTTREQAMKHLGLFGVDKQRPGPLADLPRPMLKMIVERIRQLAADRQLAITPQ
jgi:phage terminase small subunit